MAQPARWQISCSSASRSGGSTMSAHACLGAIARARPNSSRLDWACAAADRSAASGFAPGAPASASRHCARPSAAATASPIWSAVRRNWPASASSSVGSAAMSPGARAAAHCVRRPANPATSNATGIAPGAARPGAIVPARIVTTPLACAAASSSAAARRPRARRCRRDRARRRRAAPAGPGWRRCGPMLRAASARPRSTARSGAARTCASASAARRRRVPAGPWKCSSSGRRRSRRGGQRVEHRRR